METLNHLIASLDIFQVLINAFPAIFKPLYHGFESLFSWFFVYVKHLVEINPGLISGAILIFLVYLLFAFSQNLKKSLLHRKISK